MFPQSAKISPKCTKIVPSRAEKRVEKRPKKVQKCQKKPSRAGKRVKKRPKKRQNGLKNETIRIVAGHSEQNEQLFVCLGREYSFCLGREYSLVRTQKNVKMDRKTKRFGLLRAFGTKTNRWKKIRP